MHSSCPLALLQDGKLLRADIGTVGYLLKEVAKQDREQQLRQDMAMA